MQLTRALSGSAAAATMIVVTSVLAAPVHAAPASSAGSAAASSSVTASAQAVSLARSLGSTSAGVYLDTSGRTTIAITDASAAPAVRAAGAVPKVIARSSAALAKVTSALHKNISIPGTAWAVDPATNRVVVSADSTVTGSTLATVKAQVKALGDAATLESVPGTFTPKIRGGDAIYGGQYVCSLGFNVRSGSTYYFLTAGHCTNIASTWYANSAHTSVLGTTAGSSFPGNDYGIVRYTSTVSHPGTVDLYNGTTQDITSAGTPVVGQTVRRSGRTTHVHSGTVTALNATVNYAEGTVTGLIRTTVCAEGGDSGGALFSGTTAYGTTSGGSGNCTTGGTTFFQPVTEALSVYGVSVY